MKFSAVTTFLVAALPTVLATDYTFTCARIMFRADGGTDADALDHFTKLFTKICINNFKCAHSYQPALGAGGALVNGGCIKCPSDLNINGFADCLLAPIPGT
ncbi:hypothetical protein E4U22_002247 [Claviceps purpurea]|nr:hypothetical protein E4U34_006007 [Claviceps purpurea]KAG6219503.1 hypothetical protein E4U26_007254 [Claviceps purpurea]KAG6244604.1 hypothetical protein E4U23_006114 [Claviceps purpurea]KAG6310453.1 hypothetical protein E4U44_005500 [Claviceps purpurea]KAG6311930.1 hypothetical protein E4U22_002247 [Claviceps purpurea]